VNLGISGGCIDSASEMEKVILAEKFDVESIMNLNSHSKTCEFRKKLIATFSFMIGTVPVYDAIGYFEKA
jgi:phosphomethylpyrimidine synthase